MYCNFLLKKRLENCSRRICSVKCCRCVLVGVRQRPNLFSCLVPRQRETKRLSSPTAPQGVQWDLSDSLRSHDAWVRLNVFIVAARLTLHHKPRRRSVTASLRKAKRFETVVFTTPSTHFCTEYNTATSQLFDHLTSHSFSRTYNNQFGFVLFFLTYCFSALNEWYFVHTPVIFTLGYKDQTLDEKSSTLSCLIIQSSEQWSLSESGRKYKMNVVS